MKTLLFAIIVLLHSSFSNAYASDVLVNTKWLKSNISNPDLVIIDMSDETQYQRFHIQNAIQLPYRILNQKLKNGVSISIGSDNIVKLLGLLGITTTSHVVVYDDTGGLHASRLLWELERINHPKVSLLDGGLVKWILEGNPVTATSFQPKSKTHYPLPKSFNTKTTATITDVLPASRAKDTLLIDVRSKEEYIGNVKQRRSGHIPGAKLWNWDNAINFQDQFKFKTSKELTAELSNIGLNKKNQSVILYCRSAHRASQSYVTLRTLGFIKVKIYDGSMNEYGITANAPLTKGPKP